MDSKTTRRKKNYLKWLKPISVKNAYCLLSMLFVFIPFKWSIKFSHNPTEQALINKFCQCVSFINCLKVNKPILNNKTRGIYVFLHKSWHTCCKVNGSPISLPDKTDTRSFTLHPINLAALLLASNTKNTYTN